MRAPHVLDPEDAPCTPALRILLLEDREEDAQLVMRELRQAGLLCEFCRVDTEAGFTVQLETEPDLILADFSLPGFDALRALDILRARHLDIPFLIVSGSIGEDVAVAVMQRGAADYLLKDRLARLGGAVRNALHEKGMRDERRRMEAELRAGAERLRSILCNVADSVLTVDETGVVETCNPAAERLFGYSAAEIVGCDLVMLIAPDRGGDFLRYLRTSLRGEPGQNTRRPFVTEGRRRDGSVFPMECSASEVPGEPRRLFITSLRDISERQAHMEALEHQALHDALTNLPNRGLLNDRLKQAIAMRGREQRPLALLVMDMDRFKEINDTLGHHCGDQLLQRVAERLRQTLPASDTVARLGGDEFAVLAVDLDDPGRSALVARQVLSALERPFLINQRLIDVGASVGIAVVPDHGTDASTLMRRAEVAMYAAKRARSGFAFYSPDQDETTEERLGLLSELRRAIERDELVLHYQPKTDISTGRATGAEALLRWDHPEHGLMAPDQFIPLAEQTDVIRSLTRWVLETAMRQLAEWQRQGLELDLAINLSARAANDAWVPEAVRQLADELRVAPRHLTVEITESSMMGLSADATLRRLSSMGVQLSIDDFGTGYSSLVSLRRLPVDEIKIDKSFILDITSNPASAAIVRPTIALGHSLGLRVVAEGVEDSATLELLGRYGCDTAQGYFVAEPLSASALTAWLAASRSLARTRVVG